MRALRGPSRAYGFREPPRAFASRNGLRALAYGFARHGLAAALGLLLALGASPRGNHAGAQGAVDAALLTVSALEAQIAERRAKLERERAHKSSVEAALVALPEQRRKQAQTLARDVHALYRLRRGGLLPIADGLEALMHHASRIVHLERMARRDLDALDELGARQAQLARERAEIERAIQALDQELLDFEDARAKLVEPAPLAAAPKAAPPEQFLSVRPSEGRMGYGLSLVGARVSANGSPSASALDESARFEAQRGALALPVSGMTSVAPKQRDDGARGVELTTGAGMSVRAAADGVVTTVERETADGLRIVLEHGPRFRTIYSGLASVDVEPGDAVSKSARLGAAGASPVYFEVRHGRRSQDARSWLGL